MFGKKDYVIVVVVLLLPVVSGESKYKYYGANEAGEMSIHVRKISAGRERSGERKRNGRSTTPRPLILAESRGSRRKRLGTCAEPDVSCHPPILCADLSMCQVYMCADHIDVEHNRSYAYTSIKYFYLKYSSPLSAKS